MNIKKDDLVVVLAGEDADPTRARRVLRVLPEVGKVVVEGVNRVYKHLKPNRRNQQGGRLSKEMPVDQSNVQLFCAACKRGRRTGKRYADDGHKELYCKKCGITLRALSKPNERYAKKTS